MSTHAQDNAGISPEVIVALATPRGIGALAIVRVSGERAIEITSRLVRHPENILAQASHTVHLTEILSRHGEPLDRALAAVYRKPNSYTGENSVELFLHGSPYIISQVLNRYSQFGARMAQPGEFTLRAFLNGRLDLAQAEAVADLIAASGERAHRSAIAQRQGILSLRIAQIRERLIEMCSLIELDIDFTYQDLPLTEPETLLDILSEIESDLRILEQSFTLGRLSRAGATVVIAGAPNVGKSTLFNALIGEDRAIIHETPGTTRDAIEATVTWEGFTIRLVDTAGQADHFGGVDREAVQRARQMTQAADLVLWMFDLTDENPEFPKQELTGRTILIGNKVDLPNHFYADIHLDLEISASQGHGLDEIKRLVLDRLLPPDQRDQGEVLITRERHYEAVQRSLQSLIRGRQAMEGGQGIELLSEDLREAVRHLGEIIGVITPDDVLNRIFADFCIGK